MVYANCQFFQLYSSMKPNFLYIQINKCLDWTKPKGFADNKLDFDKTMISVFDRVENILGKVFSPPTMFSKALCSKDIKTQDCMVKS